MYNILKKYVDHAVFTCAPSTWTSCYILTSISQFTQANGTIWQEPLLTDKSHVRNKDCFKDTIEPVKKESPLVLARALIAAEPNS